MKVIASSSSVAFSGLSEISYASVRAYNQFLDMYPGISPLSGDLKNFQRPWVADAICRNVPKGGPILEMGAGGCAVAEYLRKAGYEVWVVDPFDGSGGGPNDYEGLVRKFSQLKFVKNVLHLADTLSEGYFRACYSCSVIEHIPRSCFEDTVAKIHDILAPGGISAHAIDWTLEGIMVGFAHIQDFVGYHGFVIDCSEMESVAKRDLDTYFLSPQGHYRWRSFLKKTYEDYPYRKVTSFNFIARK